MMMLLLLISISASSAVSTTTTTTEASVQRDAQSRRMQKIITMVVLEWLLLLLLLGEQPPPSLVWLALSLSKLLLSKILREKIQMHALESGITTTTTTARGALNFFASSLTRQSPSDYFLLYRLLSPFPSFFLLHFKQLSELFVELISMFCQFYHETNKTSNLLSSFSL